MAQRIMVAFLMALPLLNLLVVARANSGHDVFSPIRSSFLPTRRRHHSNRCPQTDDVFVTACTTTPSNESTSAIATSSSASSVNEILSLRGGDGDIQTITSLSQLQTILDTASQDNKLVVLDFTSNNCPPCEMIAPIYTDLSQLEEFQNVIFCKVNVSDHPEVAERYGVDGWPTFLLFKGDDDGGGVVVDSVVGGQAAKAGLYGLVAKHA